MYLCIWHDSELERLCHNLNFRHRKTQLAGRASIEYYFGQVLKATGKKTYMLQIEIDGAREGTITVHTNMGALIGSLGSGRMRTLLWAIGRT